MKATAWRSLAVALRVGILGAVILLTACQPEQTPASAARTAAALRTPAAAAPDTSGPGGVPTLAPRTTAEPTPGGTVSGAAGTGTPQPKPASATPQAPPASLAASPNPVPFEAGQLGTTSISWSAGETADGQVYVSDSGQPEKLFSSGSSGSQDAPWIQPGHSYEFRLYAGTSHDRRLATIAVAISSTRTVVTTPRRVDLSAEPNPVPADDLELGTTTVTWSTDGGGAIYVSQDDGPEQLFASGLRGNAEANWICRGSTYEFRLYTGSQRSDPLKTLTVTRAEDDPDHEPPPAVECNGAPGQ